MGLEVATYIASLVASNPVGGTDQKSQGDDHLRLVKSVLQSTFPNASKAFYFPQILTKSIDYALLVGDGSALVLVDTSSATRTISLPNTGTIVAGWNVTIMKVHASNSLTIDTPGAETINGAASVSMTSIYDSETFMWDGTEWKIIANTLETLAATTSLAGKVELLTQAELNTGTDSSRVPTADILKALQADWFTNRVSSIGRGHIAGLGLSNNGSDATNDIDIAVGEARDSTNAKTIVLASALTKRLDAAWAVGTNQGGLDTGSIANDVYHMWLIMRSDTGVVDVLFSASATSPTMPTNYDYKRRIGAIIRESATIVPFVQYGDDFFRKTPVKSGSALSISTTAQNVAMGVPDGINVEVLVSGYISGGAFANGAFVRMFDPGLSDLVLAASSGPGTAAGTINSGSYVGGATGEQWIYTDTSGQIRVVATTTGTMDIWCHGWRDSRGRDA